MSEIPGWDDPDFVARRARNVALGLSPLGHEPDNDGLPIPKFELEVEQGLVGADHDRDFFRANRLAWLEAAKAALAEFESYE